MPNRILGFVTTAFHMLDAVDVREPSMPPGMTSTLEVLSMLIIEDV